MDTKSEEGDPGGDEDTSPLTEDERALLERLRGSGRSADETPADDTPASDTTLPGARPSAPPDGLDPIFREPTP
jgi:hypothetical protein